MEGGSIVGERWQEHEDAYPSPPPPIIDKLDVYSLTPPIVDNEPDTVVSVVQVVTKTILETTKQTHHTESFNKFYETCMYMAIHYLTKDLQFTPNVEPFFLK